MSVAPPHLSHGQTATSPGALQPLAACTMTPRRRSQLATIAAVTQAERSPTSSIDDAPRPSQTLSPRSSTCGARTPTDIQINQEGCKTLAGSSAAECFEKGIIGNAQVHCRHSPFH